MRSILQGLQANLRPAGNQPGYRTSPINNRAAEPPGMFFSQGTVFGFTAFTTSAEPRGIKPLTQIKTVSPVTLRNHAPNWKTADIWPPFRKPVQN
jgi:hypothetical protein